MPLALQEEGNMSAPANIMIRNKDDDTGYSLDYMLLSAVVPDFSAPYAPVRTFAKAYNNVDLISDAIYSLQDTPEVQECLNRLIRESIDNVAWSILNVRDGVASYLPVSKVGYQEYVEQGPVYNEIFQYIITISDDRDEEGDSIWEIMLMEGSNSAITRTVKQWLKFSDLDIALERLLQDGVIYEPNDHKKDAHDSIKDSIHLGEVDPGLLRDIYRDLGPSPCDSCLLCTLIANKCVTTTVHGQYVRRTINQPCYKREGYATKLQTYLLQRLSYDKELQDLLRGVSSKLYLASN
jgi:hypothetical protein